MLSYNSITTTYKTEFCITICVTNSSTAGQVEKLGSASFPLAIFFSTNVSSKKHWRVFG